MSAPSAADTPHSPWRWAALVLALAGADLSRLLSSLIDQVCQDFAADQAVAYVMADGQAPPALASRGVSLSQQELLAARRCCSSAADDRTHPDNHPALDASAGVAGAAMCTRMVGDAQTLGCLWLARPAGPPFSAAEQELLDLIGQLAALAVRNARVHALEQRALAELHEAEQAKSEFLSNVSHELRTPLTAIRASAGLLLDERSDPVSATQRRLLASIVRNTGRLTHLVGDLLDMARLQDGQLPLTCTLIDLRTLARTCVAALQPLLDQKGQTVEIQMPPDLAHIIADRRRIEQVLTNLLSNAHKYAPHAGRIVIEGANEGANESGNEGGNVRITVRDNGPGVPPGERAAIFRRFYRGASAQDGPVVGAGLGLAVARSLVELHGGSIACRDAPGGGSAFDVILPVRGPGEAEP